MTPQPNDPTQVGSEPPRDAGDGLHLSGPEILALGTKAARGAGFEWGQAEEAGWAAAWLARAGLPGAAILLDVLEAGPLARPSPAPGHWRANGPQCPLCVGLALQDFAGLPEGPGPGGVVVDSVIFPVFVMPFVSRAARALGCSLEFGCGGERVLLHHDRALPARDELAPLQALGQGAVRIAAPDQTQGVARFTAAAKDHAAAGFGGEIALDTWEKLDHLAMRTTVAASASSRAGAGAQESDND